MRKHKASNVKASSGALAGFIIMEVGIILILVAQSFGAICRLVVFGSGILVLLIGLGLFVQFLVSREMP